MNWEGMSATRGGETAVSGRAPEINSHTQSCPKMERVVSHRSECRVGGSFQGVAGSSLIRSGMETIHTSGFGPRCVAASSDPETQWGYQEKTEKSRVCEWA